MRMLAKTAYCNIRDVFIFDYFWRGGAMESIRMGSKGSEVKKLQELLRQHGFKEVEVDGEFGKKMFILC